MTVDTIRPLAPAVPHAPDATRAPQRRSSAVDAVRVLATTTVVAAHAFAAHPWSHHVLFSWHVPIFLVLSGYLWSRRRTVGTEVRRRARTLLVPYVSWLLLVAGVWWAVSEHRGRPLGHAFFSHLWDGGGQLPFAQYWFITALFFTCLYARLLARTWLIGLVGAGGLVAVELWPDQLRGVELSAGIALPCLAFLAVGIVLRDVRERITRPLPVGAALLALGIVLLVAGVAPVNVKQADLGTPGLGALVGASIAVGLVLVAEGLFVGRFHHVAVISLLATAAMPVVLGHVLVLCIFADRPLDAPVWVFALAVVGPWTVGLIAARIRPLRAVLL